MATLTTRVGGYRRTYPPRAFEIVPVVEGLFGHKHYNTSWWIVSTLEEQIGQYYSNLTEAEKVEQ